MNRTVGDSRVEEIKRSEEETASLVVKGTRYRANRFRWESRPGRPWSGWMISRFGGQRYTRVRSQPREGFPTLNHAIAFAEEREP